MARKRNPWADKELTLQIHNLSHEGRGIARFEEKVCFVFGALPGETVKAKIVKKHSRYFEAQTLEVLKASPEREKPPCDFFGICGGCQIQHLKKPLQLVYKTQFLKELLQSAKVTPQEWAPSLEGKTIGYRQKARLGVRYLESKEELLLGFREQSSNKIARMEHCKILDSRLGDKLEVIKKLLLQLDIKKHIPQIEVSISEETIALIFRHLVPCEEKDKFRLQQFGQDNAYAIYLQPEGNDSVRKIWPQEDSFHLSYSLPQENLQFSFHPLDFIQVNQSVNQQMVAQALAWLNPKPAETLLDLFCGLGNFSLPFAKYMHHVTGIEGSGEMVLRAHQNAVANRISNCAFHAFDLTKACGSEEWAKRTYDKILLDPSRSGAKEIIEQFKSFKAKEVLYISCNPATFARDAEILVNQQGYQFIKVGVMDMFPHTAHLEVMGLFRKS